MLREELGMQTDKTHRAELCVRLGLSMGEIAVLLLLYKNHRALSSLFIESAIPSQWGRQGERTEKIVQKYVCTIRKVLGFEAITTHWGLGYQLSDHGRQTLAQFIEPTALAA